MNHKEIRQVWQDQIKAALYSFTGSLNNEENRTKIENKCNIILADYNSIHNKGLKCFCNDINNPPEVVYNNQLIADVVDNEGNFLRFTFGPAFIHNGTIHNNFEIEKKEYKNILTEEERNEIKILLTDIKECYNCDYLFNYILDKISYDEKCSICGKDLGRMKYLEDKYDCFLVDLI